MSDKAASLKKWDFHINFIIGHRTGKQPAESPALLNRASGRYRILQTPEEGE